MRTQAQPPNAPSEARTNLGQLFYHYLKTAEKQTPGLLKELVNNDDALENQHIGTGRLFMGLEMLNVEPSEQDELRNIQTQLDSHIPDKANKKCFRDLMKTINNLKFSLSIDAITPTLQLRDEFIRALLGVKYNARLDGFLRKRFPGSALNLPRESARRLIHNAIFFRCLTHLFLMTSKNSKKLDDFKHRQKFLLAIYNTKKSNAADILIELEIEMKRKINADLQSETIFTALDNNHNQPIISHLETFPAYLEKTKLSYEFALDASLVTHCILTHFYRIAVKLQNNPTIDTTQTLLSKSFTTLMIDYLKSDLHCIHDAVDCQVTATVLIQQLKQHAITDEFKCLNDIQEKIENKASKSASLTKKPSPTKHTTSADPKPNRPALPTTPKISELNLFTQQIRETPTAIEATEPDFAPSLQ